MRISDYEDYLNSLSLAGVRQEAKEFASGDNHDRKAGLMILKKYASMLKKSTSNSEPLTTAYDRQMAETRLYQDRTGDYYLPRP